MLSQTEVSTAELVALVQAAPWPTSVAGPLGELGSGPGSTAWATSCVAHAWHRGLTSASRQCLVWLVPGSLPMLALQAWDAVQLRYR